MGQFNIPGSLKSFITNSAKELASTCFTLPLDIIEFNNGLVVIVVVVPKGLASFETFLALMAVGAEFGKLIGH